VPVLFRQNFLESMLPQVFGTCPVGLAVAGPEGQIEFNQAARELLAERVGPTETAWRNWTAGAVARLAAGGQNRACLPGMVVGQKSLEARLAGDPTGEWQLLALLAVDQGSGQEGGDLAETVSTLSHELRTPLTSMKSSLNLVLGGETGPLNEDQRHFLEMTLRNINRLDRLVGDLLDVSRADAGHLNLRPRQVDLARTVGEAVDSHRQAAREAGLGLEYRGPGDSVEAWLDPDKLVQMVSNLVSNAIKYTPAGGQVVVKVEALEGLDTVRVEVRDNGPGMDPETARRAQEPFQRTQASDSSSVPGTGLGLHITKRLAEAQGGKLGLESRLGVGTIAWIDLPLGREEGSKRGKGSGGPIPI
jgi:signal transduction histidine kinase